MVGFVVVDELLVFIAAVLGKYHRSGGMGLVYIGIVLGGLGGRALFHAQRSVEKNSGARHGMGI